jgi:hypothetical protein
MSSERNLRESEGAALALWCAAMVAVTLYGRDFVHCDVKSFLDWLMAWPQAALTLVNIMILLGICAGPFLLVYYSFTGKLERVKSEIIDPVREAVLVHYRRAPRMWTITIFVIAAYIYGQVGRYDVHYYERGSTGFVRVHDRILNTVIYRHPDDSCTTGDDE